MKGAVALVYCGGDPVYLVISLCLRDKTMTLWNMTSLQTFYQAQDKNSWLVLSRSWIQSAAS